MSNYETKKVFARNLSNILATRGEAQADLAQIMKVAPSSVSAWCSGDKMPRMDKIEWMAQHFGVSTSQLLSEQSSLPSNLIPYKPTGQVPILGIIPAGMAALAVEDIEGYTSVDVRNPEECFALRVKGDSMINAGIYPGDLVIIRTQHYADNRQIVACRINGDEATLKRFTKQGDTVVLVPENPNYPVQIVNASDFENGNASIIGVAIEVKRIL